MLTGGTTMNAAQRREKILEQLHGASAPISASALAAKLGVSRQIVVGDVALLRAGGAEIEATPRGYQFHPTPGGYTGILACVHRTADEMRTELYTVVDQGGVVVDVAVETRLRRAAGQPEPRQPIRCGHLYHPGSQYPGVPAQPDDRRRAPAHPSLPG